MFIGSPPLKKVVAIQTCGGHTCWGYVLKSSVYLTAFSDAPNYLGNPSFSVFYWGKEGNRRQISRITPGVTRRRIAVQSIPSRASCPSQVELGPPTSSVPAGCTQANESP